MKMRIEIRGNQVLLDGYVNAVLRESRVLPSVNGRFKEQVVPKTFERALQKAENVDLLFNHDKNRKLGSTIEGNLELFEDNIGLRAIATITDEDVINKARNDELKGWSFGFVDNKPNFKDGTDGIQMRYLEDIDLLEVSILDKLPAYLATTVEMRGEENVVTEQRNEEFTATIVTVQEEKREEQTIDYSLFERDIEIQKLKGGN
jgi:uncharacterized protein